jgi:hypothetical protein
VGKVPCRTPEEWQDQVPLPFEQKPDGLAGQAKEDKPENAYLLLPAVGISS